jgi:hypothetical protein
LIESAARPLAEDRYPGQLGRAERYQQTAPLEGAKIGRRLTAMLPLFGVFLVVMIKDTIRDRENLAPGNKQTQQMIALTFLMLASYIAAAFAILLMVVLR